jgi:quinolinate synthase
MADAVLSTAGMYAWCAKSSATEFVIGTEMGILYKLRRENPGKTFHLASRALICPNMKLTTLEDVRESLETMSPSVTVPADIREKAVSALEAMIRIPRDTA